MERYQQLVHEKELLNERWDEQNSLLVESHERVIAELTDDYENKLSAKEAEIQARACQRCGMCCVRLQLRCALLHARLALWRVCVTAGAA